MSSFRFSIRKNRPLKPTLGEVQHTNEILAGLLATSDDNLAAPVLRSIQGEGQENAVFPVDPSPSGDEMLEAASLKGVDEDSLRKVRFAFRDWRKKSIAVLNTPESLHALGMDAVELNHYLDADNVTLFVAPGEFDSLAWRCAMGFEFGNHAINHVSDLTGAYAPKVAPVTPIHEPTMPSSPLQPLGHPQSGLRHGGTDISTTLAWCLRVDFSRLHFWAHSSSSLALVTLEVFVPKSTT